MFQQGIHKPHGVVIATSFDGVEVQRDTEQCVHCGAHWIVVKGSGRPHMYCGRCGGNTCSNARCLKFCYPTEKRMDDIARLGHRVWPDGSSD